MNFYIKDIKKDDSFWECESGMNAHFTATCDAWNDGHGWWVSGKADDGAIVKFFDSGNGYGPKLYTMAQYGYSKS